MFYKNKMVKGPTFILLSCVLIATQAYDGITIGKLPPLVREELMTILKDPFGLKGECGPIKAVDVRFFLSTRSEPNGVEVPSNKPEIIDGSKKMVFIIHGWLGNYQSENIIALRDAYLKRYDCNVIMVDWQVTAYQPYTVASCELAAGAQKVSTFLCVMSFRLEVPLAEVHVVGHSLGAHMAGIAGYNVKNKCQQTLGRISGLDPTAPMFFRAPENERLDAKDALFVDVIHTDSGYFGYYEPLGQTDFSPNCAGQQPGCMSNRDVDETTLVTDAMCNHLRSVDLMTESVNSQQLIGVSCGLCPRRCQPDIINEVYQVMGEDCRAIPKPAKNFYLPTNSSPPFGLGLDPYKAPFTQKFNSINKFFDSLP